ncbi:hypothetical protein [Chryseobacterium terrae]|uniref:Lipoprotein n=1 Tax=Chryseobacterium terrae TaxID=3163299 RepID=A0ABW8Y2L5_9FLAO
MDKFLLILFVFLISCEEKTFADDIVLNFPKDEKLTFQKFNDDLTDRGTSLIYIGEIHPQFAVNYYKYIIPPVKIYERDFLNSKTRKKFEDSIELAQQSFFRTEKIKILETNKVFADHLNSKNLSILVKEKDTIPLYKQYYKTNEIKKYKAFPVIIKNTSTKILKIPTDAKSVDLWILNNNQFRYVSNSNYIFRGSELQKISYFELKPDEILIYSCPYFKKGEKRKAKIKFGTAESKEFEISVDENIIRKMLHTGFIE